MKGQDEGWSSKIACFDGIAVADMDIQQILPKLPEGEELYSGCFQIMTLTPGTATDKTYIYLTAEDAAGVDDIAEPAWFDDGMNYRLTGDNAVFFAPGEGFLVSSDIGGSTVTFAGEVATGATISELGSGWTFKGNNALQALDIQAIKVGTECDQDGNLSTPVDDLYSGAFQIMTLTPGTATDKTYIYLTAGDAEGVDGDASEGWFDDGMNYRLTGDNAVSFEVGDGFLVSSDYDSAFIKIPGNQL